MNAFFAQNRGARNLVAKGTLVNALGGQSVINVRQRHDAPAKRDLLASQVLGITRTIEPLVVSQGGVTGHFKEVDARKLLQRRLQRLGTDGRVRFHDFEFAVTKPASLQQHSIRDADFADVVKWAGQVNQPDVFVVCHDPMRTCLLGDEEFAVPSVEEIIELTIRLGSRTNPAIRAGGVSFNTSALAEAEARALMARESERLGLPVADPIRGGAEFERLVDSCLA